MSIEYRSWYSESLQRRSLRIVTEASEEQLTLAQARQHLRLDTYGSPASHPDDDIIMDIYLPAAREYCEVKTGRAFVPQLYELGVGSFPYSGVAYNRNGIEFPVGPITSIQSVIYADANGVDITLNPADYRVDLYSEAGFVYPTPGLYWPTGAQALPNAVRVQFYAGYDLPASSPNMYSLPRRYRAAMLLMLTHFYENRSQVELVQLKELPLGVHVLLGPDALRRGFA